GHLLFARNNPSPQRHKEHKEVIPAQVGRRKAPWRRSATGIQIIFNILHTKTATPPLAEGGVV
ncbi:MAG: hypothetical protein QME51_06075, partial [Planctomycetota bacterium]|nr:hypothetical protein [Planctomycetota bacterium]MDI6787920.1 hypothetical protein [Planctomycetota bacterium]